MFGLDKFTAVINPPEAAILAVGALREAPKIQHGGQVTLAHVLTLTLSVDHRVADGVLAALFMQTLRQLLENPIRLLALDGYVDVPPHEETLS
jgi:pyruvate dehydrogenase E2 component (dihydrolipoamide acetyltransferase)